MSESMNEQTSELKAARPKFYTVTRDELQAIENLAWMVTNSKQNVGLRMLDAANSVKRLTTVVRVERPTPSPILQAADEMEKALKAILSQLSVEDIEFLKMERNKGSVCGEYTNGEAVDGLTALEHYAKAKGQ